MNCPYCNQEAILNGLTGIGNTTVFICEYNHAKINYHWENDNVGNPTKLVAMWIFLKNNLNYFYVYLDTPPVIYIYDKYGKPGNVVYLNYDWLSLSPTLIRKRAENLLIFI